MAASYRLKVNLALGAGLALMLVLVLASYTTIQAFLFDARLERESQVASLLLERTVSGLKTAESWQRKFILTGADVDLKAYAEARRVTLMSVSEVRRADAARDEGALYIQLKDAIDARLVGLDDAVQMRQTKGLAAATAIVASPINTQRRERIEHVLDSIRSSEAQDLQRSLRQKEGNARATERLIMGGGLLALALLLWAIYLLNRHERRRHIAEQNLAKSMLELQNLSAALRASEAQMRDIIDAVPALIAYIDVNQHIKFHNRAYQSALLGASTQLQGQALHHVLGSALYAEAERRFEQALGGENVVYEREQRNAQGELRDIQMRYFPHLGQGVRAGEVLGVYAMGSDVTDFKRIDRLKSEFVSTVSHELRTPLTSIRVSLGLLAGGVAGDLSAQAAKLITIAHTNCERLLRMVNDILDIDKIEAGKLEQTLVAMPLYPLLEIAIQVNEAFAAEHQVTLMLESGGEPLMALVDADRLVQVVTNLLSNAIKFSPPLARVEVRLRRAGGSARVAVSDAGPGVPVEFQNRIFEKFSQADGSNARRKGGTGLGLNISRALVEQMGGRLEFHNEPTGGATFFFELPLAPASSDLAEPNPAASSPTKSQRQQSGSPP